jgi:hypothetical protein
MAKPTKVTRHLKATVPWQVEERRIDHAHQRQHLAV